MNDGDLADCVAETLADAEHAHNGVAALLELLDGCPPGHQLTAAYLADLMAMVQCHLTNVVDGLRVVEAAGLPA